VNELVIAFDVGATNTRARIASAPGNEHARLVPTDISTQASSSRDLCAFVAEVAAVAGGHGAVVSAVVAVAGPVNNGRSTITNWTGDSDISVPRLEDSGLPVGRTSVVNDVVAGAWGALARLDTEGNDFVLLSPDSGRSSLDDGCLIYVAPGTGLGAATLVRHGYGPRGASALGCEFQHTPAPRFDGDLGQVADSLASALGHAPTWEEMVSGRALPRVYAALHSAEARRTSAVRDPEGRSAERIADAARTGDDPAALAAINAYYRVLARFAQALALASLPCSAVVVGGNSTAQNLDLLRRSGMTDVFARHDTLSPLLGRIPLYAVDGEVNLEGGVWLATHG
jgi:glucokinase